MNWEALGAIAEFLGAIGVIATLAYLAVLIRQNTRSLDEGRKLAEAQSYEKRFEMVAHNLVALRDSPHINKLTDLQGMGLETEEDRRRFTVHMRWWSNFCDNLHFQYEKGYIDEDYYQRQFKFLIQRFAPGWRSLGVEEPRSTFKREVDRILALPIDPRTDTEPGNSDRGDGQL